MDMTETLAPKSDQLNADDLIGRSRTVTITGVSRGDAEQPVNVTTAEFGDGRPFKPCKSMRRVMVAAWGADATAYVGRRMTLYRDDKVRFGPDEVGGIRISHMSHLSSRRLTVALTVSRGRRSPYVVELLPDEPAPAAQGLSAAARDKWVKSMFAALNGAGCTGREEQLRVITLLAGRGVEDAPEHRDGITDEELKRVVGTLGEWKKAGTAAAKVADLLGASTSPVTEIQLAQLRNIREAEWDDDLEGWGAYVQAAAGVAVTDDTELTSAQAAKVIDTFNEEASK